MPAEPLHARELGTRAAAYLEALGRAGLEAAVEPGSLRDYSVRVAAGPGRRNRAVIYYRPTKKTFTLRLEKTAGPDEERLMSRAWTDSGGAPAAAAGPGEAGPGPGVHVFVDGSHLGGRTGYGAVILRDGKPVREISGRLEGSPEGLARQVSGEIEAVRKALAWCLEEGIGEVTIHYDYQGLESWVTGRYRARIPLTAGYRDFVRGTGLSIRWRKVRSHSGNRWNDAADRLARRGAGEGGPAEAAGSPGADEARKKALEFLDFLTRHGLGAELKGVYNGQYARLAVTAGEGRGPALFDLYNTARKPMTPRVHGGDRALGEKITKLWSLFEAGGNGRKADGEG